MIIKDFKLFESSYLDNSIWRLDQNDWDTHFGPTPNWALKKGIQYKDIPLERD